MQALGLARKVVEVPLGPTPVAWISVSPDEAYVAIGTSNNDTDDMPSKITFYQQSPWTQLNCVLNNCLCVHAWTTEAPSRFLLVPTLSSIDVVQMFHDVVPLRGRSLYPWEGQVASIATRGNFVAVFVFCDVYDDPPTGVEYGEQDVAFSVEVFDLNAETTRQAWKHTISNRTVFHFDTKPVPEMFSGNVGFLSATEIGVFWPDYRDAVARRLVHVYSVTSGDVLRTVGTPGIPKCMSGGCIASVDEDGTFALSLVMPSEVVHVPWSTCDLHADFHGEAPVCVQAYPTRVYALTSTRLHVWNCLDAVAVSAPKTLLSSAFLARFAELYT